MSGGVDSAVALLRRGRRRRGRRGHASPLDDPAGPDGERASSPAAVVARDLP
jgi:hypothetical protein